MRRFLTIAIIAILLICSVSILLSSRRHRSDYPKNSILNNLRQLDGAKQEWLLDKKPPTNAWPSKADMMHYLGPPGAIDFNQCVPPSDGEIYIVNRADRPVAVYLTKDYSVFKEGQLLTIDDIQPPYNP